MKHTTIIILVKWGEKRKKNIKFSPDSKELQNDVTIYKKQTLVGRIGHYFAIPFFLHMRNVASPLLRMFLNTASGVSSLNGGTPVRNSKRQMPRAHQSTAEPVSGAEKSTVTLKI